jgi:3-oxoacyl-[acyl-carrier protein] reductase
MNIDLSGKNALVCGSTQGIGNASARILASLNANVTLLARNETALKAAVEQLGGKGYHSFLVADFSDPEGLRKKITEYVQKHNPIHILVNNTGGPPSGPITLAKTEEFLSAFNSHLICNHILATVVLPGMKEAGYGRIINIISTSVKQPLKNLGVSNTIRAAVGNWAKTLSNDVAAYGITVNNVLPGATATQRLSSLIEAKSSKTSIPVSEVEKEMLSEIPARRFAAPEEVANAVAFLASPAASYINGINLPVDGGRTSSL